MSSKDSRGKKVKWCLRFEVWIKPSLEIRAEKFQFKLGDKCLLIKSADSGINLSDTADYVFFSNNFVSESEALEFGKYLEHALITNSILEGFSIDFGSKDARYQRSKEVYDEMFQKLGGIQINEFRGLQVYPDYPDLGYEGGRPTVSITANSDHFFC